MVVTPQVKGGISNISIFFHDDLIVVADYVIFNIDENSIIQDFISMTSNTSDPDSMEPVYEFSD